MGRTLALNAPGDVTVRGLCSEESDQGVNIPPLPATPAQQPKGVVAGSPQRQVLPKRCSPHSTGLHAAHRRKLPNVVGVLPCKMTSPDIHDRAEPYGGFFQHWTCALQCPPPPSPGPTHRGVPDAAGKGHPTALPAWVQVSAVEIDIEVPVIGPSGSTARPLRGEKRAQVS